MSCIKKVKKELQVHDEEKATLDQNEELSRPTQSNLEDFL